MRKNKLLIDGAIFDVDGTLLTSNYAWQKGAIELLGRRNISENEISDQFMKRDLNEVLRECKDHFGLQFTAEEFMDELNSIMEKYYFYEVKVKDGVFEYLSYLRENNIKMTIATATERYLIEKALERNNLKQFFDDDCIFTTWEVGKSKFDPLIFDLAREKMNTAKEKTAVFEDSYYSMKTAKKFEYIVCGVYDDFEAADVQTVKSICDFYEETLGKFIDN